jgi:hypothetical protein
MTTIPPKLKSELDKLGLKDLREYVNSRDHREFEHRSELNMFVRAKWANVTILRNELNKNNTEMEVRNFLNDHCDYHVEIRIVKEEV